MSRFSFLSLRKKIFLYQGRYCVYKWICLKSVEPFYWTLWLVCVPVVPSSIPMESLVKTVSEDNVIMQWEAPTEPNGIITKYEVSQGSSHTPGQHCNVMQLRIPGQGCDIRRLLQIHHIKMFVIVCRIKSATIEIRRGYHRTSEGSYKVSTNSTQSTDGGRWQEEKMSVEKLRGLQSLHICLKSW